MENTSAINLLFVQSKERCQKEGCEETCVLMDMLTGKRFCQRHAPRLWIEEACRNINRIEEELKAIPNPCVVW